MKTKFFALLALLAILPVFTACDNDEPVNNLFGVGDSATETNVYSAIGTLTKDGSGLYCLKSDIANTMIFAPTYDANYFAANKLAEGDRAYVIFQFDASQSGNKNADKWSRYIIPTFICRVFVDDPVVSTDLNSPITDTGNLVIYSVWESGNYLNIGYDAPSNGVTAPQVMLISPDGKPDSKGVLDLEFIVNLNGITPTMTERSFRSYPIEDTILGAKGVKSYRIRYSSTSGEVREIIYKRKFLAEGLF